jgi:lipopolysaccharide transport system permease protein
METAELDSMAVTAPAPSVVIPSVHREAEKEVLHLVASAGWKMSRLLEVWRNRELLMFLAWRDVKVRYKQTVFGAAWAILQPVMMMLAFSVFFWKMGGTSTGDLPPALFFYSGLLPWQFFATAVNSAGNSVVSSERLVTKIYFPRLLIPLASISTALVDFCVAMGLMGLLMIHYRTWGGAQIVLAPFFLLAIAATAAGIGTFTAAMTVRYRDVKYCLQFALQFGMFATPSVYLHVDPAKLGHYSWLLALNPMNGLISAFRAACVGGPIPWATALPAAAFGLCLLLIGCLYFQKIEDRFADEI